MIFVVSLWYALSCSVVSLAFAFFLVVVITNDLYLPLLVAGSLLWVLRRPTE